MEKREEKTKIKSQKIKVKKIKSTDKTHIGSSNAFEETENPLSRDADNISDEKLDELVGE